MNSDRETKLTINDIIVTILWRKNYSDSFLKFLSNDRNFIVFGSSFHLDEYVTLQKKHKLYSAPKRTEICRVEWASANFHRYPHFVVDYISAISAHPSWFVKIKHRKEMLLYYLLVMRQIKTSGPVQQLFEWGCLNTIPSLKMLDFKSAEMTGNSFKINK